MSGVQRRDNDLDQLIVIPERDRRRWSGAPALSSPPRRGAPRQTCIPRSFICITRMARFEFELLIIERGTIQLAAIIKTENPSHIPAFPRPQITKNHSK